LITSECATTRELSRVGSKRNAECGPFYGFSLSFTLAGTRGRPTQAWRCLSRIAGTVLNGTVLLRSRWQYGCMLKKNAEEESGKATLLAVKKEMAKPRMAKSARGENTNLAAARIVRGKTER
jgi:hypothetical protein